MTPITSQFFNLVMPGKPLNSTDKDTKVPKQQSFSAPGKGFDSKRQQRLLAVPVTQPYLIFVIFFTRAKFLENKIYTEKMRKLRQNTQ